MLRDQRGCQVAARYNCEARLRATPDRDDRENSTPKSAAEAALSGGRSVNYFTVTARLALPPPLLLAVMFTGLVATERVASYLPPPLFVNVPRTAPVEVLDTVMVAVLFVLVASTRSVFLLVVYS